jgi:hypothetical protein
MSPFCAKISESHGKYGKMPYVFRKNLARFGEDYRKTFKGRFREIDWAGKQAERLG